MLVTAYLGREAAGRAALSDQAERMALPVKNVRSLRQSRAQWGRSAVARERGIRPWGEPDPA